MSPLLPRWLFRRPVLLLLGLTALLYWKLIFSDRFTFLNSPDQAGQVVPWFDLQAKAWNEGVFPLWDPYEWGGQPLLGQMQPGGAFPLNWPLFAAPLSGGHIDYRWIHLQWALMHLLAALLAYALARELGSSKYGSLLAGLGFAGAGYLSTIAWPQMLSGAVWLPLTLLLFHRAARASVTPRVVAWGVLCGGSIGMSLLSGHHQTPYFSLLALTLIALGLWRFEGPETRAPARRLLFAYGAAGFAALLVAGLQLLPAAEYAADAYRWVNAATPVGPGEETPYFVHSSLRLFPVTLLGVVVPQMHFQVSTYVGWVLLTMGLYGLAFGWRERWTQLYALVGLAALLFAFGPFSFVHGWAYQFLPLAHTARSPAHAVFVAQLCLFLLAARGLDKLLSQSSAELDASTWIRRAQWLMILFAGVSYYLLYAQAPDGRMESEPGDQMIIAALFGLLLASLLQGYKRAMLSRDGLRIGLALLLFTELSAGIFYHATDIEDPKQRHFLDRLESNHGRIMGFLGERSREGERFRFEYAIDDSPMNIGSWNGLEDAGGFLASVTRGIYDMGDLVGWERMKDELNTVYTIAAEPKRAGQVEVFSDGDLKVYRNPTALPRARLIHSIEGVSDAEGGVVGLRQVESCEGGESVQELHRSLQRVELRVEAGCAAYLVLADAWAPGWRGQVGGRLVPVRRYLGGLRAVAVPAGSSRVIFAYQPRAVYIGAWMSGLGFLLCLAAGVWLRRERGR